MEKEIRIGKENFVIGTGRMAKQAAGAVTVQCGGTVVLVAVSWSKEAKEDRGFLPLSVDYREKTYAAGKIPGGFFKREGRPTEKEILSSRLIDRTVRPLFPKNFNYEVQVVAVVLSADGKNEPDWLAINGASAALALSDLPIDKRAAAVRIGRAEDGQFIINPTYAELEKSELNLVVAGTKEDLIMLEGEARETSEDISLEAIKIAQGTIKEIIILQEAIKEECGKEKSKKVCPKEIASSPFYSKVQEISSKEIEEIVQLKDKKEGEEKFALLFEKTEKEILEDAQSELSAEEISKEIKSILQDLKKQELRCLIAEKEKRQDGRGLKEVRALECETGVLPCTHGSSLFSRGQTQSLAVVTLGTKMDEQIVESLEGESRKKFMLHYNFPSFSVGEV
ncbi:MAG: polyribonucleotide nucleotidyltransferase, partial [Candidatus Omnitrophica bacterium]|nr:polyribonucleotide nucleotidyltransferase [Candidatus Omnitrophota bacterium]